MGRALLVLAGSTLAAAVTLSGGDRVEAQACVLPPCPFATTFTTSTPLPDVTTSIPTRAGGTRSDRLPGAPLPEDDSPRGAGNPLTAGDAVKLAGAAALIGVGASAAARARRRHRGRYG